MRQLINDADEMDLIERRKADQDTKVLSKTQNRVNMALERLRKRVGGMADAEIESLSKEHFGTHGRNRKSSSSAWKM